MAEIIFLFLEGTVGRRVTGAEDVLWVGVKLALEAANGHSEMLRSVEGLQPKPSPPNWSSRVCLRRKAALAGFGEEQRC